MNENDYLEDEDTIDLRQYWNVLRRRKWVFIAAFVCIFLTAVVYDTYRKPVYRAETTLIIEPDVINAANISNSAPSKISADYQETQYEIICSYAVAKKAVELLGISSAPSSDSDNGNDPVAAFQQEIKVQPVKDSRLVRISMEGADPEKTAEKVNVLARAYIQHNLQDRKAASRDAFTWLSEQIVVLKAKVKQSEMDLLTFQEKEDVVSLDKRQALLEEKLFSLQESYTQAANHRTELEIIQDELEKLIEQPEMAESLPRILENPLVQTMKADYSKLDTEMAKLSKKFKPMHPQIVSLQSQIDNIRKRLSAEVEKISKSVAIEYRLAKAKEDSIGKNLDSIKRQSMQLARQAINFGVLKREAESNRKMYDVLLSRLKETDIGGSIAANNIRVVDKAKTPLTPVRPKKKRNAALAAVVGLFAGIGLCFLIEQLDNSIRNEEDVAFHLKEPLLGLVPDTEIASGQSSKAADPCARYYRDVKTILGIHDQERMLKTVLFTSSVESEGKTTSATELGKMYAMDGRKVLLMDMDFIKQQLAKSFDLGKKAGITSYFSDNHDVSDIIHRTAVSNLFVMPPGQPHPNPTALIASEKMRELIERVKPDFDIVLIDTMPVGSTPEIAAVARNTDGVAFVVRAKKTSRVIAQKGLDKLKASKCSLLGVILTRADLTSEDLESYYGYYDKQKNAA